MYSFDGNAEFSASPLYSSVSHDPCIHMLIWCSTILIIIKVENSCVHNIVHIIQYEVVFKDYLINRKFDISTFI